MMSDTGTTMAPRCDNAGAHIVRYHALRVPPDVAEIIYERAKAEGKTPGQVAGEFIESAIPAWVCRAYAALIAEQRQRRQIEATYTEQERAGVLSP